MFKKPLGKRTLRVYTYITYMFATLISQGSLPDASRLRSFTSCFERWASRSLFYRLLSCAISRLFSASRAAFCYGNVLSDRSICSLTFVTHVFLARCR